MTYTSAMQRFLAWDGRGANPKRRSLSRLCPWRGYEPDSCLR